jgi:hypothetical protein
MNHRWMLYRAVMAAALVTIVAGVWVVSASASGRGSTSGYPPAALATWSESYQAKAKVYREQLAAQSAHAYPPAALRTWSDSYVAKENVYQQQQLAEAEQAASAFHWDDAVIGGGTVLAIAALALAGVFALRIRRGGFARPLSSELP